MYAVRLMSSKVNATTGLRTVFVRAEAVNGNQTVTGPEKGYHIDPDSLQALWSGDVRLWLQYVKAEHQRYHGTHSAMGDTLKSLEGSLL